jgi:hypothetical protein
MYAQCACRNLQVAGLTIHVRGSVAEAQLLYLII